MPRLKYENTLCYFPQGKIKKTNTWMDLKIE